MTRPRPRDGVCEVCGRLVQTRSAVLQRLDLAEGRKDPRPAQVIGSPNITFD